MKNLSVIIPVYNEEKVVGETINGLKKELTRLNLNYEIIAINDGSTDKTKDVLEKIEGIEILNHPYNKGNGAALKTGIKAAKFDNLLFFDADGQHKAEYIQELIKYSNDFDMVVGARTGYKGPFIRQPGKKILLWLANYLSNQRIPDLNCGFRIIKKDQLSKLAHLLCDGFSFYTTVTLIFISEGLSIKYIPITINKRRGKSKVKSKDALDTFILILRIILLSSPLRVFLPITGTLILLGFISFIIDIIQSAKTLLNISDSTILLFISSLLVFFFGLLADQIAAIRKEIKK
jgi:glycosyltransferase involved in cell wall biosynthesis